MLVDSVYVCVLSLRCGEKDFLDNVIKKAVAAKEINHKGQGVWVTLRKLQGDLKQVRFHGILR